MLPYQIARTGQMWVRVLWFCSSAVGGEDMVYKGQGVKFVWGGCCLCKHKTM